MGIPGYESIKMPKTENILVDWIKLIENNSLNLTQDLITFKACSILKETKEAVDFKFSNGWCMLFKKKFNKKLNFMHGNSNNVDLYYFSNDIIKLRKLLKE